VELRKVAKNEAEGVSSGPMSNGRLRGYRSFNTPSRVAKSLATAVGGYWLPKFSSFPSSNPATTRSLLVEYCNKLSALEWFQVPGMPLEYFSLRPKTKK
jgi:hypothetical protein